MDFMFSGCSSLKELNLNNFNTNNVTNMRYMFSGCLNEFQLKIKNECEQKSQAFNNTTTPRA